jgi:hypothetical protein
MKIFSSKTVIDMQAPEITTLRDDCKVILKAIAAVKEGKAAFSKLERLCFDFLQTEIKTTHVLMSVNNLTITLDNTNIKEIYRQYLTLLDVNERKDVAAFNCLMDLFFKY